MSSSYSKGSRIALDYLLDEKSEYLKLKEILKKITDACGKDVSVSTHFVQTDSKSWNSVVNNRQAAIARLTILLLFPKNIITS